MKKIKIAYIGGGSKAWARVFMTDLALAEGLCGEIALYDIDVPAAELNKRIGARINDDPNTVSKWDYRVYTEIGEALDGADFVACSILPGTFEYYISEPVVENDAKGVAPFVLCYTEVKRMLK